MAIGKHHQFCNDTDKPIILKVEMRPGHEGIEKSLTVMCTLAKDSLADSNVVPKGLVHACLVSSRECTSTAFIG